MSDTSFALGAASPALGAANGGPGAFSTTTEDGSILELADDAIPEVSAEANTEISPVLAWRGRQHADPIAAPSGIGRAQLEASPAHGPEYPAALA